MESPLLEVKGLRYSYPDGSPALNGADLSLMRGEKLAVIGPNGSGKSTLLAHLAGCFPVPAGNGGIVLSGRPADPHRLRSAVGLVFQDPDDQLFMPSVLEDVAFGLVSRGMDVAKAHERALSALETLSAAHLAPRPPHRLSGGEKRMAALAGILAMDPEIVVLDEPTSTLDPRARRHVIGILKSLGKPMILATHDLDMVLDVCTRAVVMNAGRAAAEGPLPAMLRDEAFLRQNGLEAPLSLAAATSGNPSPGGIF